MKKSSLESQFLQQVRALKIEGVLIEYKFHPVRRWRFDFCFPRSNPPLAVEIEGGTWMQKSRHTSSTGFEGDCIKYAEALKLGWRVLRVTGDMVKDGRAIKYVEELL